MLDVANSKEFHDVSPRQFVPTLADRNLYYASESAFYRLLRKHGLLHHRARSRPPTTRPRALTATGPDQVYSWDITYLRSRVRGVYFYLYLVVDIWSRRVVGSSTCSGSTHRSRRRASVCQAPAGPVRSTTASTACTSSTGTARCDLPRPTPLTASNSTAETPDNRRAGNTRRSRPERSRVASPPQCTSPLHHRRRRHLVRRQEQRPEDPALGPLVGVPVAGLAGPALRVEAASISLPAVSAVRSATSVVVTGGSPGASQRSGPPGGAVHTNV
jgi:hypothetical protein